MLIALVVSLDKIGWMASGTATDVRRLTPTNTVDWPSEVQLAAFTLNQAIKYVQSVTVTSSMK